MRPRGGSSALVDVDPTVLEASRWAPRLRLALHPDARDALLADVGPEGSPMRCLVERAVLRGDAAARACSGDWW